MYSLIVTPRWVSPLTNREAIIILLGCVLFMGVAVAIAGWGMRLARRGLRQWAEAHGYELVDHEFGLWGRRWKGWWHPLDNLPWGTWRVTVRGHAGAMRSGLAYFLTFRMDPDRIDVRWDDEESDARSLTSA